MTKAKFPARRLVRDTSGSCDDELSWLNRELRIRQGAFARWIKQGKMFKNDADAELAIIENIIKIIERVALATASKKPIPVTDPRHPFYIKKPGIPPKPKAK